VTPANRELFAHLSRALSRYIPEANREAKSMGLTVPRELLTLAEFFTECARTRQDATSGADLQPRIDAGFMTDGLLLTKHQAAAELACSVRQVERLVSGGLLRTVPIGDRRVRIRRADLEEYVAGLASKRGSFRDEISEKGA
jgi:excisionase family DNA binding protein